MTLSAKGGNYKLGAPGNETCLGDGVAIGLCARALGCNAIDIGCCSCVACNSAGAVAIGQGAHIEGANCAVALGPQSGTHCGVMSVAVGAHIRANGECGISIGGYSCADYRGSITIGPCACSIDQRALAIGARAVAAAPYSVAIGSGVTEQEELNSAQQQATGHCCTCAHGSGSLAIGYGAYTECGANDSLALMPYAHTTSRDAVAIGVCACTGDTAALAIGSGACALGPASIALGPCRHAPACEGVYGSVERETIGACACGAQAIAIGSGAYAPCNASIAIGVCSIGNGGISIGCYACANGAQAIAIGDGVYAEPCSICIGREDIECVKIGAYDFGSGVGFGSALAVGDNVCIGGGVIVCEGNCDTIVIGNCSMAGCGCANIVIGCHACACGFHISCWYCGQVTGTTCVCNDQSIVIGNEARSYPLGGGVTIGYGSQTSSLRGVTLGPGNSNHGLDCAYHTCCSGQYCHWGPVHTLCFVSSTGVNASCADMCGSIGNAQDTTIVGNGIAMTAYRSMAIGDWSVVAGHCSVAIGSHMGIGYWHNCNNKCRYECYLGDNPSCFGYVSLLGGYGHCICTSGQYITVVGGSAVNTRGNVCNLFIAQSRSTCISNACNGGGIFLHCPSISCFNCLFIIDACVCGCTYTGSDERDKANLTELSVGLDFVNSLCAYEGNWNKREKSRLYHLRKFDSEIKAYQCYINEDLTERDEFNQINPEYIEIDEEQEAEVTNICAALPAVAQDEDEETLKTRKQKYRNKIKNIRKKKAEYEANVIAADPDLAEPRKSVFLVADNVKEALDKFDKDYTLYSDSEDDRPGQKIPSKSLVYSDFIPILVKAIQELSAKVDKLEGRDVENIENEESGEAGESEEAEEESEETKEESEETEGTESETMEEK